MEGGCESFIFGESVLLSAVSFPAQLTFALVVGTPLSWNED
jgi:hypothetical protein